MTRDVAYDMFHKAAGLEAFAHMRRQQEEDCKPNNAFAKDWPYSFRLLVFLGVFLPSDQGLAMMSDYGYRLMSMPGKVRRGTCQNDRNADLERDH